jgi:hypothetical protein
MWHCWRRFLRKRHTRIRFEKIGVLAGLGWADAQQRRGECSDGVIPLEALTTGTQILDMRALRQIALVTKYDVAGWAAHGVLP